MAFEEPGEKLVS